MLNKKTNHTMDNLQVENNVKTSLKRSLTDTSSNEADKKKPGPIAKRHKSLLSCVVCNGDAHGYNFDAISCESCKAFFRRNAVRPLGKFKCRGDGHCNVTFDIKKRCKRCRLETCLANGMRKEWILSDKEKEDKRRRIEENRRLKNNYDNNQELIKQESKSTDDLSSDLSTLLNPSHLYEIDWYTIQLIQTSYNEAVKLNQIAGISSYPSTQSIESTTELFRVPLYISSMRLISYIKQINQFQELDKDDQLYLVKQNLLTISFFHSIYIYDPRTDAYHEQDTNDPLFAGKDWIKTLNKEFHLEMKQIRNDLINIFQSDDVIIRLFFLILFFSNQMSLNQSSRCSLVHINSSDIFKAQNAITDLVYRYCLHQYGLHRTPILFSRYIHKIMKLQELVDQIKSTIHNYIDIAELSSLMQSLLE